MSTSRSPTPFANIFSTNITPSSESTTSRPRRHENAPSVQISGGREVQTTLRPIYSPSFESIPPETSDYLPQAIRPAESSLQTAMAKRLRRESPQPHSGSGARSSPSSDSQDDTIDTGIEIRQDQQSETLPPAAAPPKKKRTRTLTTPHQSAVLHALLAQSRFPTTAMREEVGRSIGLSARKVQIWFQNQRQKARRPRSQSNASLMRPPQYGAFPTGPDTSAGSSFSMVTDYEAGSRISRIPHQTSRSFDEKPLEQSGYRSLQSPETFSSSLESSSQLLGPGMPGSDSQPAFTRREPPNSPPDSCSFTSLPYLRPGQRSPRSPSPRLYPLIRSRPTATGRPLGTGLSRTLPPLGSIEGRTGFSIPGLSYVQPSHAPSVVLPPYPPPRSLSPEPTFRRQYPELSTHSSLHIPPPFTLQPSPQWGVSFSPVLRPEPSLWSRPGSRSTRIGSTSPAHLQRDITAGAESVRDGEGILDFGDGRPLRSGRYDPVRAAVMPYTSHVEPLRSTSSTHRKTSDHSDHSDDHDDY